MMPPRRNTNSLQGLGLISYVDRRKHAVISASDAMTAVVRVSRR